MATKKDLAIAQFLGLWNGRGGCTVKQLAIEMRLKHSEWIKMRRMLPFLEEEKLEVDSLFEKKKEKNNGQRK